MSTIIDQLDSSQNNEKVLSSTAEGNDCKKNLKKDNKLIANSK